MRDPGPVELEAMMAMLSLSKHWTSDSAWKYYAEKYNSMTERVLVQCPVGKELVKYLAKREKDRKRSQSNPQCMRNDLQWCFKKEQIDQDALHRVLRTGLPKERGRGQFSLTGPTVRRN
jgi:aminoglycoside phosphotransferase